LPRRGRSSRKKSVKEGGAPSSASKPVVEPRVVEGVKARRAPARSASSRREVDVGEVERVISEVSEELVVRLGLEGLFTASDLRDIVESFVNQLVEAGRRVDGSSLVKRIEFYKDNVYKYLAVKALKARELNEELAEFIVYRAPEAAGRVAPELYKILKNNKLALDTLRNLWERYGRPTPLKCPICGFRALTPDLTCMVCGGTPREEEVKEANNFLEELKYAMKEWHARLVEEVVRAGYVYYDYMDGTIKPPSMMKQGGIGAQITLNLHEKALLREYLLKLAGGGTS